MPPATRGPGSSLVRVFVSPTGGPGATRWSEVVRGLGLYTASSVKWDVQTVGGGVWVRKGWGGIAQGSVLLA